MRHETPTSLRIQKARTSLILDHPFFGSLLFRLKGRECRSIQTMATDGVSLFYNPDFVETLNAATLAGTLAHEVMHPALHHHVRRSGRDPKRWNVACDFAINPLLVDAGLSLPDGVLIDDRFRGMSAEQIYNLLESESETEQDSGKEGGDDEPGGEESKDERPLAAIQTNLPLPLPKAELARSSMRHRRTRKPQPLKNRRGSGTWRSTRPRRLPGRRARFRPASTGPWKGRQRLRSTGGRCYAGSGRIRSRLTIAGCALTAAMSGQVSTCRE